MAFFGFGEGLEPVGDLVKTFLAGGPRHARIHIGVFVGFAGDRGLQIQGGVADRLARRRISDLLEILQVAMGMAGFAFSGGAEDRGNIVVTRDIRFLGEIKIAAIGLAFSGKGSL